MPKKVISLLSLGLGIFLLVQVFMPFLYFKLWEITSYNQNIALISPNPESSSIQGVSVENVENNFPAFISKNLRQTPAIFQEFTLSITSIKVENAKVLVDTNSFEKNLAHLPGSALPGEKGNMFITGHSSLPQFFKPGNYNNEAVSSSAYKAIFANLPNVKKGEKIIIEYGGQKFEYIIQGLKVVDPKELWVINPPDNEGRYLSLMTCVPPGLTLKRLIVLAKLM